jgi:hypothetical protein
MEEENRVGRFERHWETQRLVDAFVALELSEKISLADMAARCGVSAIAIKSREQSAKRAALHEHNVIIMTVRGFGYERLPQDAADVPAAKYLAGARAKARRAGNALKHGITDWNKLERTKKNEMFVVQAQCAAIVHVTGPSARKKLSAGVETANAKLDFGRTLELLK